MADKNYQAIIAMFLTFTTVLYVLIFCACFRLLDEILRDCLTE
jgi:hypothetical protein